MRRTSWIVITGPWLLGFGVQPLSVAQEHDECLQCHGKVGLEVERAGRQVSLHLDPKLPDPGIELFFYSAYACHHTSRS